MLAFCVSLSSSVVALEPNEDTRSEESRPARRQPYIAAGVGATAGLAGVEAHWLSPERRTAFSAGAGRAGIGARTILFLEPTPRGREGVRHYLSAGYLLTPWESGTIDATGALIVEGGRQMLGPDTRYFMDMGLGFSVVHGGSWGGNTAGLVVRLLVGMALRGPGAGR
jgi:hypothetical protein